MVRVVQRSRIGICSNVSIALPVLHPADVRGESVRAVTRRVTADDVRISLSRRMIDFDQRIALILDPFDVVDARCILGVHEVPLRHRPWNARQPLLYRFCREDRPSDDTPLAKTIYSVVVFVGLAEVLQRFDVFCIKESVVSVRRSVRGRTRIGAVKESRLEPMRDRHGIERDNDLMVVRTLVTQSDVKLIEVKLGYFARFLDPYHGDTVNGLQFFNVIKSREDDLRPVSESDAHRILRDTRQVVRVVLIGLRFELTEAGFLQRLCRLADHKHTVSRLCRAAFKDLATCKDRFARTAAAAHNKKSRSAEQQRQECVVVGLTEPCPPLDHRLIGLRALFLLG